MAIVRAQVTTIQELAAWMQENAVPNIFKSVTYENSVLTATDADDKVVLTIKGAKNGSDYFRAYRGESNYLGVNFAEFPHHSYPTIDLIGCDNGFIIKCKTFDTSYNAKEFAALFAMTNNGKPAIIFPSALSSTENAQYTTGLNHVAFGDNTTIATTTTFTPESAQQTIMCGFGTNADITDVSYTPKAFYMPMHGAYNQGIGKFLCGGKVYITNGYWAIDSEEDAT